MLYIKKTVLFLVIFHLLVEILFQKFTLLHLLSLRKKFSTEAIFREVFYKFEKFRSQLILLMWQEKELWLLIFDFRQLSGLPLLLEIYWRKVDEFDLTSFIKFEIMDKELDKKSVVLWCFQEQLHFFYNLYQILLKNTIFNIKGHTTLRKCW